MIDCYKILNLSRSELKDEISSQLPERYDVSDGWRSVYHYEIDGYIVNLGYLIMMENKCGYLVWRDLFIKELSTVLIIQPKYKTTSFESIINEVWNAQIVTKENYSYDKISKANVFRSRDTETFRKIFRHQLPIREKVTEIRLDYFLYVLFSITSLILTLSCLAVFTRDAWCDKDQFYFVSHLGRVVNLRNIVIALFSPSVVVGCFAVFGCLFQKCKIRTQVIVGCVMTVMLFYCSFSILIADICVPAYIRLCISVALFWVSLFFMNYQQIIYRH